MSETQAPGLTREERVLDICSAGFDAFWELDLFGRVRAPAATVRAGAGF